MNYLAHLYLSGDNPEIRFGNFIGDAIKGNKYLQLPDNIGAGVLLHRKIDAFTDQHILIKSAKKYISSEFGHYKGVVIDVFFDHFLSKNWDKYHSEPLKNFLDKVKSAFETYKRFLPIEKLEYYERFLQKSYLYEYQTYEGIEKTLLGLEKRIGYKVPLAKAIEDLKSNTEELEKIFFVFLDEIQSHINNQTN
jgi:acyl carrier protein phosphodiesterase